MSAQARRPRGRRAAAAVLVGLLVVAAAVWLLRPGAGGEDVAGPVGDGEPLVVAPAAAPAFRAPSVAQPSSRPVELIETPVPAPASRSSIEPTPPAVATVVVTVTDGEGQPVQGALVVLNPERLDGLWRQGRTDADGRVVTDVSSGRVFVRVNEDHSAAGRDAAYADLLVDPGGRGAVTVALPPMNCGVDVFVHDEEGRPLQGIPVRASGPGSVSPTGVTDGLGWVHLDDLRAGANRVVLDPGDSPSAERAMYDFEAVGLREFEAGASGRARVELMLPRLVEVRLELAGLPGDGGSPTLELADEPSRMRRSMERADGVATWRVPAGRYTLRADWPGDSPWWAAPQSVEAVRPGPVNATLVPRLGRAALAGRLVDGTGRPLGGLQVVVESAVETAEAGSGARVTVTKQVESDTLGEWKLAGLPSGPAVLKLRDPRSRGPLFSGLVAPPESLDVSDGTRDIGVRLLALAIDVSATVRVRPALDPQGGPYAVRLAVLALDGPAESLTAALPPDGRVLFPSVPLGSYSVTLLGPGEAPIVRTSSLLVAFPEGGGTALDAELLFLR